jgi:hypothetical protein
MKFALFEEERIEATPGAKGDCPGCGAEMVARCGTQRVWHWAHRGRRHCDHWWENETQWHRDWKNHFPVDWQEITARDEHGELHIADIKTDKGLVVEFQHSFLNREEAQKRTQFHNPMFWVVDATRRATDMPNFIEALKYARHHPTPDGIVYEVNLLAVRLLKEWVTVGVIVAFDFRTDDVWVLRRVRGNWVFGFFYPKSKLVGHISEGTVPPDIIFGNPTPQKVKVPIRRLLTRNWKRGSPKF